MGYFVELPVRAYHNKLMNGVVFNLEGGNTAFMPYENLPPEWRQGEEWGFRPPYKNIGDEMSHVIRRRTATLRRYGVGPKEAMRIVIDQYTRER